MILISNEQHSINTSIILWVVGNLSVFSPDNFTSLCYETKLRNINLDNSTLCDDSQAGIHCTLRVLLNSQNVQLECGFKLRMSYMCSFESEATWSNKSFELWRLSCKVVTNE